MDANPPAELAARMDAIAHDAFEQVRNILTCATLLALGMVARNRSADLLGSTLIKGFIGWGIITLAATLALMNLWMGVRRLKRWKRWKLWSALLFLAYVTIAERVLEVMAMIHLQAK